MHHEHGSSGFLKKPQSLWNGNNIIFIFGITYAVSSILCTFAHYLLPWHRVPVISGGQRQLKLARLSDMQSPPFRHRSGNDVPEKQLQAVKVRAAAKSNVDDIDSSCLKKSQNII